MKRKESFFSHNRNFKFLLLRILQLIETSDMYNHRKSEKNVKGWPRTLLQARTQNFWCIHKPTCLLN